ncbi:hypothetical protein [Moorena sp. SIO3H5]|nr:hypothetical protein [Moorena sp. SIO3H5]
MRKILIFGNSGAGKTTLALKLQVELSLPILDLDTITWIPDLPGVRREDAESERCKYSGGGVDKRGKMSSIL